MLKCPVCNQKLSEETRKYDTCQKKIIQLKEMNKWFIF